jgi:hypothetical protein
MQDSLAELNNKLAEAEKDIANGDKGEDFFLIAEKLRKTVHGKQEDN